MVDLETLFNLSEKCVDLLDVLSKQGWVEISKVLFEKGDEDLVIILTEEEGDYNATI